MIIEELLNSAKGDLKGAEVTDVRIGLSYTGVLLDYRSLGLAYSFREEATEHCEIMDLAGELERNALELAEFSLSPHIVKSSVGIATMNAVSNLGIEGEGVELLDFLRIEKGEKVGMVGHFRPLVKKIEKNANLFIFERGAFQREGVYPDWAVERILPEVDVTIITGTAVVNKTIDHLIELSANAREIAIIGPTTPLVPDVFREYGVTFLGGMIVENHERALKIISQGGGSKKLKKVSRRVSLIL